MDSVIFEPATALNRERHFLLHHIRFDKTVVRAQGHYLYDDEGHRYLDALSQYGALPFGHNPPRLWQRLKQIEDRGEPSFVQPLLNPGAEALARRLLSLAPANMRHVTFANSGAETTEVAIKLARAKTRRQVILSVDRGFHGKTLGALSATANARYRVPFLVDTSAFETVPFGDLDALRSRLQARDVAAFIVEPVQGEGGMRVQPPGYLRAAQALCREFGTLFAVDEVQSGLGRTGKMFGYQHEEQPGLPALEPDIMLLAKALGGGLVPLGAVICAASAWSEPFGLLHSSTFANSHLSCSIGLEVLDALAADDQEVVRNAARMGELLREGLDELVLRYPGVFEAATGRGLMQALTLREWKDADSYFTAHASHNGYAVPIVAGYLLNRCRILTAPMFNASRALRLEPPLTVTEYEIREILRALESVARIIARGDFVELFAYMVESGEAEMPAVLIAEDAAADPGRSAALVLASKESPRRGSFAFLIHPTDEDVLFNTLPPAFQRVDETAKLAWKRWMRSWFSKMYEPAPVLHSRAVRSHEGGFVEGWLIACPMTPSQMLRLHLPKRALLLEQYVETARSLNVDIVGLGAFTSIISQGGVALADSGLNITTGNSLTALASAESLLAVAQRAQVDLRSEQAAVVGAAGSVGRLAALHLAQVVQHLALVGNAQNAQALAALKVVAGEILSIALDRLADGDAKGVAAALAPLPAAQLRKLAAHERSEAGYAALYEAVLKAFAEAGRPFDALSLTTDVSAALAGPRLILTATSAGFAFIGPEVFRPGAIVCDVARPLDVLTMVRSARQDVTVFEGGLMNLPERIGFGAQNVLGYPPGLNLACLSETIVLSMEGARRSYSIGNRIPYDEARWIAQASLRHGFTPWVPRLSAAAERSRETRPADAALKDAVLKDTVLKAASA